MTIPEPDVTPREILNAILDNKTSTNEKIDLVILEQKAHRDLLLGKDGIVDRIETIELRWTTFKSLTGKYGGSVVVSILTLLVKFMWDNAGL